MATIMGAAARGLARSLIPGMIKEGLTRNAGMRLLKESDIGVRRQDFLKLWAEVSGQKQREDVARFIPRKFAPTRTAITPSSKQFKTRYIHVFRMPTAPGVDPAGPKAFVSIGSNDLPTIETLAGNLVTGLGGHYGERGVFAISGDDLVYVGTLEKMGFE